MPSLDPADNTRLSVCIASYNGAKYIGSQIDSILCQLQECDELIVVDDCSTDDTVKVISRLHDQRIRLFRHEKNVGYVKTFAEALEKAAGDYVILSDQDDVWSPGRVEAMIKALQTADVVAGNLSLLGANHGISKPVGSGEWLLPAQSSSSPRKNVLGVLFGMMPYFGSAMGVRRDFMLRYVLPLPKWLYESHDLWIAVVGNIAGRVCHLNDVVTIRRVHEQNASSSRPRGLLQVLRSRILVCRMIFAALSRKTK